MTPIGKRLQLAADIITGRYEKTVATMKYSWDGGDPVYPEVNFDNLVRKGFRANELIYACISKTINASAQIRMQTNEPLDKKPSLRNLIRRPNPHMNELDFWTSVILYTKIGGRAYFEKVRSEAGYTVQLWPLRPDYVQVVPSKSSEPGVQAIAGYRFAPPGVTPVILPTRDVLEFRVWDPMGLFAVWSPTAVASRIVAIDNTATDFIKLFFDKGGTPAGILKTVQRLRDAQIDSIRARWRDRYGGIEGWLDPVVLDSDASYQKIGLGFDEMGFQLLDARNEARICMVMDVPPIIVGAQVGLARATYSNYGEARTAWWEDSLYPMWAGYLSVIEDSFSDEFSCDAQWDVSRVAAYQAVRAEKWKRATEAFRVGAITRNEFYEETDLPERGPAGDVYMVSLAMTEMPAPAGVVDATTSYEGRSGSPEMKKLPVWRHRLEKPMRKAVASYLRDLEKDVRREIPE